ncbi:MAG: hypothetical protein K9I29_02640 [Bacteroidales bacterium]|nr:hypothetical protein [Bacteroidales bacterium]
MKHKRAIVSGYGVKSTKELSEDALDELIAWLNGNGKDYRFALFDNTNQQHRYLLSLCQQFGWVVFDEHRGRTIADLNRLGSWIRSRGHVKKPLRKQNVEELSTTIYQFEQMVKKHFKPNN